MKSVSLIKELQMLTGVVSEDITLLYYLLIKDGCYFDNLETTPTLKSSDAIESFEDWFNKGGMI